MVNVLQIKRTLIILDLSVHLESFMFKKLIQTEKEKIFLK